VRALASLLLLAQLVPAVLPPTRDQLFATFGSYLESLRGQVGIPGMAAAIIEGDAIVWSQAFGQQDIGRNLQTLPDTPFQLDGLTQLFAATLVLRCVEQGQVRLDTPIGTFSPSSPDAPSTVGQVLSHTSGDPNDPSFAYRPSRYDALSPVITACTGLTVRRAFANLLDMLAMTDSVPGLDALSDPDMSSWSSRYAGVLARLAVPYAVDAQGRPSASHYSATGLSPSTGLISTVLDFAQFDRGLRSGFLLHADTLAAAWTPPVGRNGSLPHGYGWFVQGYNGEKVVWQFGAGSTSSSLTITMPGRGITLILVANGDGLSKPIARLTAGDVTASPFAKMFFQVLVK
jgi:CubicO group peptidase (beta-lactamase class C family)